MVFAQDMWWVAGITENKTKPTSWGLAELGNYLFQVGRMVVGAMWWQLLMLCGGWLD